MAPRVHETVRRLKTTEETKSRSREYRESNVFSLPVNTLYRNNVTRQEHVEFKKYVYTRRVALIFKAHIISLVNLRFNHQPPFNFCVQTITRLRLNVRAVMTEE
jgi:hypothetical protein